MHRFVFNVWRCADVSEVENFSNNIWDISYYVRAFLSYNIKNKNKSKKEKFVYKFYFLVINCFLR